MEIAATRLAKWVFALSLGTLGVGCHYPDAHMVDLNHRIQNSYASNLAERLYYMGSDRDFDYYFLWHARQTYRVPKSESNLDQRIQFTQDRSYWEVVNPAASGLGN